MLRKAALSLFLTSAVIHADERISNQAGEPTEQSAPHSHVEKELYQAEKTYKSAEKVQKEIDKAWHDFEIAQKMFIPYYTGPLITSSANCVPMGHINIQPYLFFTTNYAQFNSHRKSVNVPNTYILNPQFVFQVGTAPWMDVTVIPQWIWKWQEDHHSNGFGDIPLLLGFQLAKQTPYIPAIRLVIGELFPTGKYQHLSSKKGGLDATGGGAYTTTISLILNKILWWIPLHPISLRLAGNVTVADHRVHVHDFNAYGGGFDTDGKIKVGNTYSGDIGIEVSLTQRWVFATDIVYTYSNKDSFRGDEGTLADGSSASVGAPSSDNFSLAPAIEYNVSDTGGFIGGVWFSVTGRNSANFASLVLSYTQLF